MANFFLWGMSLTQSPLYMCICVHLCTSNNNNIHHQYTYTEVIVFIYKFYTFSFLFSRGEYKKSLHIQHPQSRNNFCLLWVSSVCKPSVFFSKIKANLNPFILTSKWVFICKNKQMTYLLHICEKHQTVENMKWACHSRVSSGNASRGN